MLVTTLEQCYVSEPRETRYLKLLTVVPAREWQNLTVSQLGTVRILTGNGFETVRV
jgi:hypothetical protein